MKNMTVQRIEEMIYVIRGQRVMLDSDLAELYGLETKRFNEQVRRNINRLPSDFAFEISKDEYGSLRSQFATSKNGRGGRRYLPMVFTELGVGMLASILNTQQAIDINIAIMRIFFKLRSYLMLEQSLTNRINEAKQESHKVFRIVFKRLDSIEHQIDKITIKINNRIPILDSTRKKIGITSK